MSDFDQTRDSFIEALIEIMERYFKYLKDQHEQYKKGLEGEDKDKESENNGDNEQNKEKDNNSSEKKENGNKIELSDNARLLLETLKNDPESVRKLVQQYASDKILEKTDRLKEINDKISDQLTKMKSEIDLDSDKGKEEFKLIERLQTIQLDKDENMKEKIYKLLVVASQNSNESESKNALNLAQKLMDKYELKAESFKEIDSDKILNTIENSETLNIESTIKENVSVKDSNVNEELKNDDIEINESDMIYNEEIETTNYRDNTEFVETGVDQDSQTINWDREVDTIQEITSIDIDKIPTSQKLTHLKENGVDIRKLHSRKSVNIEFEKLVNKTIIENNNGKETEKANTNKEEIENKKEVKENYKEEVEIER